ncbi:MAG: protein kinase domain-containing protein [Myxococcaceae bacterium]
MALQLTAERMTRLGHLLDEVLVLEAARRAQWLASLGGDDAELRPVVEQLLSQAASLEAADFLGTLPKLTLTGLAAEPARTPAYARGDAVGPYWLERELGRGGMGTVWLAERLDKALKRKVALKLPHQGVDHEQLAQRLARERDILSSLEHPNIARLYDAGVAEDGQPFLALEYVEGLPIDRYASEHALDLRQRVGLFLQVARAVAYAHARLVLHRDLKPANILVTLDGQVRLLDFGVAKLLQDGSARETELTQWGGRALTPDYASPEQIGGQSLTTASDIYSLGVVFYELVCERRPYKLTRSSMGALEEAILAADPVRPSRAAQPKFARGLAGDLDTIILKMLEKVPTARYATVNAAIDDIERYLVGQPVLARPDSAWYRAQKFIRRHRVFVTAGVAVVTAIILGAAAALWQARAARLQASRAEASAQEARFEARVARANHEFLSQIFGDAMRGGESSAMRARLDRARELLQRRFADEPVIYALLLLELAGRYDEAGMEDRQQEVMNEFAAVAEKTQDPSLLATNECIAAFDAIQADHIEEARPHVARGLMWMNQPSHPLTDASFECLRADAMLATRTGDRGHAVAQMKELLRRIERDGLTKTALYIAALGSLAFVYEMGGQFTEALEVSRQKIAMDETLGSQDTIGAYIERQRTSQLLYVLGRIADARAVDEKLLMDFRGGGERADAAPDYFLFGFALHALAANELREATAFLEQAIVQFKKAGSAAGELSSRRLLAETLWRAGRTGDAKSELATVEAQAKKSPARPRQTVNAMRIGLAVLESGGDRVAVKNQLESLRTALQQVGDPVPVESSTRLAVLQGQLALGQGLLGLGEVEAALRVADESLALARLAVLPGQTSAWVGEATLLRARIERAAGHAEAVHSLASEAERQFSDNLGPTHPLRLEAQALALETGQPSRSQAE